MKRIITLLILLTLIIPFSNPIADVSLEAGDVLHYKVISTNFSARYGSNFISTNQLEFNNQSYSVRTSVDVTVNFFSSGFNGNFSIVDNQFTTGYTDWSLEANLAHWVYFTSLKTTNMLVAWELVDYDTGFPLILYPYIEPITSSWNYLQSLGEELIDNFDLYRSAGQSVKATFTFSETTSKIYFESYSKGRTSNPNQANNPHYLPANISFENHFQISYEKSSGVLLGMHMRGKTKGVVNDKEVSLTFNYQIEKIGYNLPLLIFSARRYAIFIIVPTIIVGFLITSLFFYRKLKSKKRGNIG